MVLCRLFLDSDFLFIISRTAAPGILLTVFILHQAIGATEVTVQCIGSSTWGKGILVHVENLSPLPPH